MPATSHCRLATLPTNAHLAASCRGLLDPCLRGERTKQQSLPPVNCRHSACPFRKSQCCSNRNSAPSCREGRVAARLPRPPTWPALRRHALLRRHAMRRPHAVRRAHARARRPHVGRHACSAQGKACSGDGWLERAARQGSTHAAGGSSSSSGAGRRADARRAPSAAAGRLGGLPVPLAAHAACLPACLPPQRSTHLGLPDASCRAAGPFRAGAGRPCTAAVPP